MSPPPGLEAAQSALEDPAAKARELLRLHRSVVPLLKVRLLPVATEARNELNISDAEGYPLWMSGPRPARRHSNGLGFVEGARWRESDVGTNSLGTAMEELRPVQIFESEHARDNQHGWVCASAPVVDRRPGRRWVPAR